MAVVIARLRVENFETWHEEYVRMHSRRAEFGEQGHTLFTDTDDPDAVVVVFEWDSVDNAKAYFASNVLADSVARANARDSPQVLYLEAV